MISLLAAIAVQQTTTAGLPIETDADRVPKIKTGGNCLIKNGHVITVAGPQLDQCDVLVRNGKIAQIGKNLTAPSGVVVIDATGEFVMPGLIDAHSHRGEDESNEWTSSAVPEVKIHDVLNPEQVGLWHDLANGITSAMLLHGSSDAIGGESVVVKNLYKKSREKMIFTGAPRMLKFALGENVTGKNDSSPDRFPISRAGVESVYVKAFTDAQAYQKLWENYRKDSSLPMPRKDSRLETLSDILKRKIWIQCHSYRQDEILMMVRLSQRFGFKIGAMQHALEAYKIAPELAEAKIPASIFSDSWAYKVEVYDAIPMGGSLLTRAGVITSVNTDTFGGLAPLNLDAAKLMRYGISEADAVKSITINPAIQLGIEKFVGTLEPGKDADISIWKGHPLSVYSKCELTLVNGEAEFQRRDAFRVDSTSMATKSVRPTKLIADLEPALKPAKCYALIGGTVHPVDSPDISNGVVLLRGSKIEAIGDSTLKIPNDAFRIDVRGKQIYPGFFDGGSDVGIQEVSATRTMIDNTEQPGFHPDLRYSIGIDPEASKIAIARCAGITTSFVHPQGGGLLGGQGCVINLNGYTRESMLVQNGSSVDVFMPDSLNPQFKAFLPPDQIAILEKGIDTGRAALRDYLDKAKRYQEARKANISSEDAKLESLIPVFEGKRPLVIHVNSEDGIRAAMQLLKDYNLKGVIAGAKEAWKVAPDLAKAKVAVLLSMPIVACPGENSSFSEMDPYDSSIAAAGLLAKAGVKFAFEVGDSSSIHNLPWSAGYACAFGLSHEAAIRAITLSPAEIFGVTNEVGSLQPGKLANVVVTDGDPLEITTQVEKVFIAGQSIQLSSKFTNLYRKYEKRVLSVSGVH